MSENDNNQNIGAATSDLTTWNYNGFEDGSSSITFVENNIQNTSGQLKDLQELHNLDNTPGGASSKEAVHITTGRNFGKVEVTPFKGKKGKSAARPKSDKKKVNTNNMPKQGEVNRFFKPTKPRHFIGYYVCKEHTGVRFLGTVTSYNPKKKLLKVEYEDGREEYLKQDEVVKHTAMTEDIEEGRKRCQKKKKMATSGNVE